MSTENTQNNPSTSENSDSNQPDYIAMQYRVVRIEDGWRTRKERIGAAWKGDKNSVCFRPSGKQIIEGDVYLYPVETDNQQ